MRSNQSDRNKFQFAGIIVIVLVMLATFYLPDVIFDMINHSEEGIHIFSYVTRFALIYVCLFIMACFYVVNLIVKIVKKTLPKDFNKPGKWVTRAIFTILFALGTWLFAADTANLVADLGDEPQYGQVDVVSVVNGETQTTFELLEDANDPDAPMFSCYRIKGLNMRSGYRYRVRLMTNSNVMIAVEEVGKSPISGEEG